MVKIILLMIELPKGAEQIILGIAGNEKEAEEMAENAKKDSRRLAFDLWLHTSQGNFATVFSFFNTKSLRPTIKIRRKNGYREVWN